MSTREDLNCKSNDVEYFCPRAISYQVFSHAALCECVVVCQCACLFSGFLLNREAYRGALSEEELDALDKARTEKEKVVAQLLAREQELRDLRDSQFTSNRVSWSATMCGMFGIRWFGSMVCRCAFCSGERSDSCFVCF